MRKLLFLATMLMCFPCFGQVSVVPFSSPRVTFLCSGTPCSGGLLYTYQAGTTTQQVTYSDVGTTPNSDPVVLDTTGSAVIYLRQGQSYKFVLQDSVGVQQWSQDNITAQAISGPLDLGAYGLTAASGTFKNLNSVRLASQFTGSDCGAKIIAADADLGATAGEIWVTQACGTAWTTAITLSANHALRLAQCGTYTTSHTITVGQGSGIVGGSPQSMGVTIAGGGLAGSTSAQGPCIIQAAAGAALTTVVNLSGNFSFLQDLTIDGNQANGGTTGLASNDVLISGGRPDIERVVTENSAGNGMQITSTGCCGKIHKLMSISNFNDGEFLNGVTDTFISDSEFENNGWYGIEFKNSSASRVIHSDIGGNGQTAGASGMFMWGASGGSSSNNMIASNQFGNNYGQDIFISGYDTVGGAYSAQQESIVGNVFIGSGFRANATSAELDCRDCVQNTITGNTFTAGPASHVATYGLKFSETSAGRAIGSTVTGNVFDSGFTSANFTEGGVQTPNTYAANIPNPAPVIATHFNTSGDSITANGVASFTITVGTGAGTSTGALTLPTATHGWTCWLTNQTRADLIQQTGTTTTSATFTNFGATFAATNWTNSDVLRGGCSPN